MDCDDVRTCEACRLADVMEKAGRRWRPTPRWSVNPAEGWTSRPWFVVQTVAHRADLPDLTPTETGELGRVLAAVSAAVTEAVAAERTYVLLLNELAPPHVHFHVVARLADDPPDLRGPHVLGTPAAGRGWSPEIAGDIAERILTYSAARS